MTKAEFVRIASRIIAVYLLIWAIVDCTYLPQYFYTLLFHLNQANHFANQSYWAGFYKLETASMVLRIAGMMLGALLFWNAGPRILRLLSPTEIAPNESNDPPKS